jgi:hypothetical protein
MTYRLRQTKPLPEPPRNFAKPNSLSVTPLELQHPEAFGADL